MSIEATTDRLVRNAECFMDVEKAIAYGLFTTTVPSTKEIVTMPRLNSFATTVSVLVRQKAAKVVATTVQEATEVSDRELEWLDPGATEEMHTKGNEEYAN